MSISKIWMKAANAPALIRLGSICRA